MKKIAVCCGQPMIPTMIFSGAELYCPECGAETGILDAEMIESNKHREALMLERQREFIPIARHCIPYGARRDQCKRCDGGQMHLEHATKDEIKNSEAAYSLLSGGYKNTWPLDD